VWLSSRALFLSTNLSFFVYTNDCFGWAIFFEQSEDGLRHLIHFPHHYSPNSNLGNHVTVSGNTLMIPRPMSWMRTNGMMPL